jgi:hypothetical protein
MLIDIKKPEPLKSHQALFDFARAYLGEAFPNPEGAGCPQDHVLRSFARNPRQGDPTIADHVTCCSPCFTAYTTHLEQARADAKPSRQTTQAAWIRWCLVSASLAIGLIVVYGLLRKPQNEPSTTRNSIAAISQAASPARTPGVGPVPVLLDLTTATPERGRQPRSPTRVQRIPAETRIDLTLRLPIGSEAGIAYSLSLRSKRRTEWSSAARARIEDGEPVLSLLGDFSHIPDGTYELVVASKGQRLRLPIVIRRPPDEQQ